MTTDTALATVSTTPDLASVIGLVTNAVGSDHTRRAYERALADFLTWRDAQGRPAFSRALVQDYARWLVDADAAASSVNHALLWRSGAVSDECLWCIHAKHRPAFGPPPRLVIPSSTVHPPPHH